MPYKGEYRHEKTRLVAAAFCINSGIKIIFHISNFERHLNPEKQLILDILKYLDKFSITFGWYTTGLAKYDKKTGEYIGGKDSDFFILDKRCQYHNIQSPVQCSQSGSSTFLHGRSHIDLHMIYSKEIIQKGVFNDKYRTLELGEVSQTLLGVGKYSDSKNNTISGDRSYLLPIGEQINYVGRDSELTMMLASYNDCLVLRIMEFVSIYSEMDYTIACHTGVTKWYANIYNKMIERGECTLQTSEHKIPKQDYGGGNSIEPIKGFYKNEPIDELDVKGMYPTIAIKYNVSFETVNCRCCKDNPMARIPDEVMNEINILLQKKALPFRTEHYWICKLRTGSYPKVLTKLLKEREKYQSLLKEELAKSKQEQELINYYNARQIAAKLLANAGYGVFGRKEFEYADYRVSEIITGFGRLTHKKMKELGFKYGFQTVFGFTDSIFVRHTSNDESNLISPEAISKTDKTKQNVNQYIDDCHNELNVRIDHKNRFMYTIIFDKKNRYIAWSGNYADRPVLKNLDGVSRKYPKWVKNQIQKVAIHLITKPDVNVTPIIQEAIDDLDHGRFEPTDMQFTEQLDKDPRQYPDNKKVRIKILGLELGASKGETVYWYESLANKKGYSINIKDLSITKYKNILLAKIEGMLTIAGYNIDKIKELIYLKQSMVTSA
jgi:DNA polymerase elongation subunit (family B)